MTSDGEQRWTITDLADRLDGVSEEQLREWQKQRLMPASTGTHDGRPWWTPAGIQPWMNGLLRGRADREHEISERTA